MDTLLGRMFLAYALYTLGMSLNEVLSCRSGACLNKIKKAKREAIKIEWKPISIFSEEAKKFK